MQVVNCPKCGKLFTRYSEPICDECVKVEEQLFQEVRKYIDEHPDNTLEQVSRETGASIKKIMKYLQDGRLETSSGMGKALKCGQCGRPIKSGNFCDSCVITINQSVTELFDESKRKGVGMHAKQERQ